MKKLIILFVSFFLVIFTNYAQTDCEPVSITNVQNEGTGTRVNWTTPIGIEEVIMSQSGNYSRCTGDSDFSLGVYHRFTPEELNIVNGSFLTQIVFVPGYHINQQKPGHTYTIQIYQGGHWGAMGDRNPGKLILSQDLNNDDLLFKEENTITFDTPIPIDASQELWIGYFCTNIDSIPDKPKGPIGIDDGPRKEGYGNIAFIDNKWQTFYEFSINRDYNSCIKGVVQTIEGATVNLYFNGGIIESNVPGTTYFHSNPAGEEYCYEVEVNCKAGGVSPLSNKVCIPGVGINENETLSKVTVYPNPAGNELRITNYELRDGVIEIYDVYGRMQKSRKAEKQNEGGVMVVNISHLSAGVYFMRIFNDEISTVLRFIKE